MNTDDILTLLDEIPSDVESEEDISDDEDGENIYSNKSTTNQVQPFDINNIPIDFLDDNFIPENTVEEWDTEDELPLATNWPKKLFGPHLT
nr:unnamed protein product [Callosobruchus chinensis]